LGDTKSLVFVVKKRDYLFGVFISAGIQLPDDPTGENMYDCDGGDFSLASHFHTPKIMMEYSRVVWVAGREGSVDEAKLTIGRWLWLGHQGGAADDMRSCRQIILRDDVPDGYVGVMNEDGIALLGGSAAFMADEVEVLSVV